MSGLIDGLPDAVALQCLARVPFCLHPHLQLVCRSWRAVLRSSELLKVRYEVSASEEILCVLAFEPENVWQLYDPISDLWMTLPVMPSGIWHLARFGVASVSGKLFVLGGGSDVGGIFATNEVWSYDPLLCQWVQRAPMLVPRAMFACCALDGKIIVAGGFTNCRKSISKAEIYDPVKDVWHDLPDLCHTRNSACSGVVIGGKMHVLHKGLSTVQILEDRLHQWAVEDYGWLQGPMAVVRGELYVLSHGLIWKIEKGQGKRKVVSSASEFQSRIGYGMMGLGDEIYVLGGLQMYPPKQVSDVDVLAVGSDRPAWRQVSDVDVLAVGSDRPAWRQVAPMTRCFGSILGCALMRV